MDSKIINALVDFGRSANLMDVMGFGNIAGLTGYDLAFVLACKNNEPFVYRMSDNTYVGAAYSLIAWSFNLDSKRFVAMLRASFEKGETPESLLKKRSDKNDRDFWTTVFEFIVDYSYKAWQENGGVPNKTEDGNVSDVDSKESGTAQG